MLVELLSAAMAPLLAHLQRWLAHGMLEDPCSEFFVAGVCFSLMSARSPVFTRSC